MSFKGEINGALKIQKFIMLLSDFLYHTYSCSFEKSMTTYPLDPCHKFFHRFKIISYPKTIKNLDLASVSYEGNF